MATSTLSFYKTNSTQVSFSLVSTSSEKSIWKVASRSLSTPLSLEISRKLSSGNANDHITVRIAQVERNASTAQLATAQVLLDISVPKDQSILTQTVIVELLGLLSSLLDDSTALQATSANRTAIADGRDL